MDDAVIEKYREAGRIAKEARELAAELAVPGTTLLEIAEETEAFIRTEGAQPAFPVNLSLDAVAAHYTPGIRDDTVLETQHVLNIDVGVHVDGYIGDTAVTVNPSGTHTDLVSASDAALDAALDMVEPGVNVGDIGETIESVIEGDGFKPIRNLSGHGLDRYVQHAGNNIPNIATDTDTSLETGQAIAIEPFATPGAGRVKDGNPGNIYRLENSSARGRTGRKLVKEAEARFHTLPFTSRWIENVPAAQVDMTLSRLIRAGNVHAYDVLTEADDGLVSQHEHTVIVLDEPIVTTR